MKLRLLVSAMSVALMSQNASAINISSDGVDRGTLDTSIKVMHVIKGNENVLDKTEGTGYLAKLKYETPKFNDAKIGLGYYHSGGILTDFDAAKLAKGMYVTDNNGSEEDATGQLGEAYIDWRPDKHRVFGGRMLYKTPLTKGPSSLMPSFFTVFGASTKALGNGLEVGIARATEMSLGARTRTEWGVIGEATGTAGTAVNPVGGTLEQAKFIPISQATAGANAASTEGMTVFNMSYTGVKNLKLSLWDYYVHDIANNIYLEAEKTIPMKGKKVKLSGQYLTQSAMGAKLYNNTSVSDAGEDLDFSMYGIKASVGNKKWGAFAAYNNSSGATKMLNAWGGDPAYTSSIFSRNAYRENVSAYKIGGHYKLAKGWMLKAGFANYGQSDTTLSTGGTTANKDATELDIILVWKPMKNTMVKLFHANRMSEYDTDSTDRTMGHTRIWAQYKF